MTKRRGPTAPKWGQWRETRQTVAGGVVYDLPDHQRVFVNDRFFVQMTYLSDDGFDGTLHLSIHAHSRSPVRDWRLFQRLKNELCGPEREAVELYPAESRLVDEANEYHLWVSSTDNPFPFGFQERMVLDAGERPSDDDLAKLPPDQRAKAEASYGPLSKARQRPFDTGGE